MLPFTSEERAFFSGERHALVKDANGAEILAGLTEEETGRYMHLLRLRRVLDEPDAASQFLALHRKHECARRAESPGGTERRPVA